jgi:hypothetical protein
MSLRPSPPRACSAPPRSRRSRLEAVLAAGLERLSLQPADVGMRAPEGSRRQAAARNPALYRAVDNEEPEPETPRRREALLKLDTEELDELLREDEQQQRWEANRTMRYEDEVIPLPDEDDLKALQAQRRFEYQKGWADAKKDPPVPNPRMTRYGPKDKQSLIPYPKQAILIKFFDDQVKNGNPRTVSMDRYHELADGLQLAVDDVYRYMAKLSKAQSRANVQARKAAEAAEAGASREFAEVR